MGPDFRIFIVRHFIDFILVIMYGVKVLFVSKADLKTKFIGALLLFAVIYLGELLQTQMMAGPETTTLWSIAMAIGLRLVALKIIFTVIDAEGNG
ncbi:MAG TPA: hypothetical protein VK709_19595 [Candidatus Saccharimonadales bacterium]|jgi:hypothetical protein|nr:hypothetical protein [Candidatus Saccharimonadales bacterium]